MANLIVNYRTFADYLAYFRLVLQAAVPAPGKGRFSR